MMGLSCSYLEKSPIKIEIKKSMFVEWYTKIKEQTNHIHYKYLIIIVTLGIIWNLGFQLTQITKKSSIVLF